ncbi:MAG TPA: SLC13 family permease [Aridibacter sp.]|nr:SLC13 family permease [Aridibacter sp.]
MTVTIAFLILVLAAMVYLFLTEKLPIDLTAFIGLVVLIFTGYVTADQAFSGFASSAVITMLAIFIVSAGLMNSGVADVAAAWIHKLVGNRERLLLVTIMLTAGILSAFMNNIAAVARGLQATAKISDRYAIGVRTSDLDMFRAALRAANAGRSPENRLVCKHQLPPASAGGIPEHLKFLAGSSRHFQG